MAVSFKQSTIAKVDLRIVVLLKSRRTGNRFYALVDPDSGYHNADAIDEFPDDMILGIAYPCLEDGLNDFAVIRTTFETIDLFKDDEALRRELFAMVDDARSKIDARITELRDRISTGQAHFLGTDMHEFKAYMLHLCDKGNIRRTLDNMMKLDVFDSVARADAADGQPPEPVFRYEFIEPIDRAQDPRAFIASIFEDVLQSAHAEANYSSRYTFDRHIFQKFIAVMFVNYATTEPSFYGTDREDYGVSGEKDMNETPLYRAIGKALRDIEQGIEYRLESSQHPRPGLLQPVRPQEAPAEGSLPGEDLSHLFEIDGIDELDAFGRVSQTRSFEMEFGAAERTLLPALTRIVDVVHLLGSGADPRDLEMRAMLISSGKQLFDQLKSLNIISPLTRNPFEDL